MMLFKKYRPRQLDQIKGQPNVELIKIQIQKESPPNMMFLGPPGVGKTSTAKACAEEMAIPFVQYNASDERGIEFIRTEIKRLTKIQGQRLIFLEESDRLTKDAQFALRSIVEKERSKAIFIFDGNIEGGFIEAIRSRCAIFYFQPLEQQVLFEIGLEVLQAEELVLEFDEMTAPLTTLILLSNGDARKFLNLLDQYYDEKNHLMLWDKILEIPIDQGKEIIKLAYEGNLIGAKDLLETTLIKTMYNYQGLLLEFYYAIPLFAKPTEQAFLYRALKQTSIGCQNTNQVLFMLMGFVAEVHVAPHLGE